MCQLNEVQIIDRVFHYTLVLLVIKESSYENILGALLNYELWIEMNGLMFPYSILKSPSKIYIKSIKSILNDYRYKSLVLNVKSMQNSYFIALKC